jgi:hypothetical protein
VVQPTPEAVVAARPVPAKAQLELQESARALAEWREARPLAAEQRLAEALEPQVPGPALLRAETLGLPAQAAPARLAPDGFPLQAPSVPA